MPRVVESLRAGRQDSDAAKVHIIPNEPGVRRHRGIGKLDACVEFANLECGVPHTPSSAQKTFVKLPPRVPELSTGMLRRAQIISQKDAGQIIARLGIGGSDRVLEAGLGSGGLAMRITRCLGPDGLHVTVEPRAEHAEVGLANLQRAQACWSGCPTHRHVEGMLEEALEEIASHAPTFDAVVLDLPNHVPAIRAAAPLLAVGGRIACYCPVTSQLEASWDACEHAGLDVEWAGELMERRWGRAKKGKGGLRPVNGPFGHTAFLLIAQRTKRETCASPDARTQDFVGDDVVDDPHEGAPGAGGARAGLLGRLGELLWPSRTT